MLPPADYLLPATLFFMQFTPKFFFEAPEVTRELQKHIHRADI
jgi:hypothetical protein